MPFALTERASVDPSQIQTWVSILLAIYGAALLVAAPVCGWLADRSSSRRAPLLLGLLALAGSTVMLCLGRTIGLIAAGRVLQGVSAAVVWVVGLALLVDTVGGDDIGQAMGYVGLGMSMGVLLAPLLGGVVFERAGYYSVWAMAFGLIGLDIVLRLAMVERKIAVSWDESYAPKRAEVAGEAQKQVDEKTDEDASDQDVVAKEAGGEVADGQSPPTPPPSTKWYTRLPPVLRLLSSRRLLSALWAVLIQSSLLTSFDSVLPLFTKSTFNWTATGAGLIFLPIVIPTFLGPLIGGLSDKHGPRWYATAGFFGCCPFLILLRLVDHNSLRQKILLCALLALIGFFLTLALTPIMAEVTYAVMNKESRRPKGYYGKNGAYAQAYSLFNIAWAAGSMVGPLLAGLVVEARGWPTATLILGCVSVFTAGPVAVWTGGSLFKKRRGRGAEVKRGDGGGEARV